MRCPVRSRRPLKIRRRLVIFVPGRTHIRSRSPRLTASSRCNNVGKGSRQIGSVTSGQGLALRAGPVGLEYEAGLGRARAGRGPCSLYPRRRSQRSPLALSPSVFRGRRGSAGCGPGCRAAWVAGVRDRARTVASTFPWTASAMRCVGLRVRVRRVGWRATAVLRTGTDQGNPTV